jgi:hypothetical protein
VRSGSARGPAPRGRSPARGPIALSQRRPPSKKAKVCRCTGTASCSEYSGINLLMLCTIQGARSFRRYTVLGTGSIGYSSGNLFLVFKAASVTGSRRGCKVQGMFPDVLQSGKGCWRIPGSVETASGSSSFSFVHSSVNWFPVCTSPVQ